MDPLGDCLSPKLKLLLGHDGAPLGVEVLALGLDNESLIS